MTKRIIGALLAASLCTGAAASGEGEAHDLIGNMAMLQRFSHKLDLAIRHENRALADFYAHELEETIEATTRIEQYDGHPVGRLAEGMLLPAFGNLEKPLKSQPPDWDKVAARFGEYVAACNACHEATGFGFINIERSDSNPFMQSFEPN